MQTVKSTFYSLISKTEQTINALALKVSQQRSQNNKDNKNNQTTYSANSNNNIKLAQ